MSYREVAPIPRVVSGLAPSALACLGEQGGFDLEIWNETSPLPDASPIFDDLHTTYDLSRFSVARTPIKIGEAVLSGLGEEFAVSDMVIKWPGHGYRVPSELLAFKGLLSQCGAAESQINPHLDEYYAYLTVQRTTVTRGEVKRGEGAHSDSIQGPRIQPKVPIEHGYLFTDHDPTRFYTHSFDLSGLDPDRDWLNNTITGQADKSKSVRFNPGDIVLFDAYTVHEAMPAENNALRTFVRLLYSTRPFDRLGNTINKLFNYSWQFQPRPVPQGLKGMPSIENQM